MYKNETTAIEHRLRKFGDMDVRTTLLGIADSSFIEEHPLAALCVYFALLYRQSSDDKHKAIMFNIIDELCVTLHNDSLEKLNLDAVGFEITNFDVSGNVEFINSIIKKMDEVLYLVNTENKEFCENETDFEEE